MGNWFAKTSNSSLTALQKNSSGEHYQRLKLMYPTDRVHKIAAGPDLDAENEWEISRRSLNFISRCGGGSFADVWFGKWKAGAEVAVQVVKYDILSREECMRVLAIMQKLRHENLVTVFGVCCEVEPILIVSEYLPNRDLLQYMRSKRGDKDLSSFFKIRQLIYMAAQIANGMAYLEKEQVIHRDLAAVNILVGHDDVIKVAGLDRAKLKDFAHDANPRRNFRAKWTAPEAWHHGLFSTKSDVWSYGIVLYELWTYGRVPYAGMKPGELFTEIERGYRMPNNFQCPDPVYSLMLECWDEDPQNRPTFASLFDSFVMT